MDVKTKTIIAYDRKDFRRWLFRNHKKERRVGVILYKRHTGKPAPSHRELMEEAICFGWIDTTIKRLDDKKYLRNFTKRNKNSKWSENTLRYGSELIKKGKMTTAGLEFYKLGLKKPRHDLGIPKNPDMPLLLKKGLEKNKKARENFSKFPPSTKKMFYLWVITGKMEETKRKRVREIVRLAIAGKKDYLKS